MNNKLFVLIVLVFSSFFYGCTNGGGTLFSQAVKKTAPKSESKPVGDSFAPVITYEIEPYGEILLTKKGKPIYTYQKDLDNSSNCIDECAMVWPPLTVTFAEDVGGKYGVLQRDDESLQVTLNGKPLYTYTPDKPYQVSGHGIDDLWEVVVFQDDLAKELE